MPTFGYAILNVDREETDIGGQDATDLQVPGRSGQSRTDPDVLGQSVPHGDRLGVPALIRA